MTSPSDLEAKAAAVADRVAAALPDDIGFAILLFDFGEDGSMAYVSNAERDDMMLALRELLSREGH